MSTTSPPHESVLQRTLHLATSFIDQRRVDPTSSLSEDLALDSIQVMELVALLEETFRITMPIERLLEVDTISDVAALITSLREAAAE